MRSVKQEFEAADIVKTAGEEDKATERPGKTGEG